VGLCFQSDVANRRIVQGRFRRQHVHDWVERDYGP
jgi:hypothetical protein